MERLKFGIIKEEKKPADRRVPFSPKQCRILKEKYPFLDIIVQPSENRCFSNEEYAEEGILVAEKMTECDYLFGVKEVPVDSLIPGKKYFFFSHTIKKQPYNKKLLRTILDKNIQMIDYECLKDSKGNRILGFGRYAGIVGAYNGIRGYGLKKNIFDLKPAHHCKDRKEVEMELEKVKLSAVKIVVTGHGRVGGGALEILDFLKIKRVSPEEFLNKEFSEAVYCQLVTTDYVKSVDGVKYGLRHFYSNPEMYESAFLPYAHSADILISCHFWDPASPVLFTTEELKEKDFKISLIADITCDINGSVPSTIRPSTIEEPFYGFDPFKKEETKPFSEGSLTVMAVDNLPCELPRDASDDFGDALVNFVVPFILGNDPDKIIERATIAKDGNLMPDYLYLEDWVKDSEKA